MCFVQGCSALYPLQHSRESSSLEGFAIARAIHVLGVVLWIGGVAMVTTVILPSVRRFKTHEEQLLFFELVEGRFAKQAKITTLITGLSGFHLMGVLHAWHRYTDPAFWWIHAMTLIWILFMMMLFVLEPLFLHRWFQEQARKNPEATLARIQRMHWVLLTLSLVTIAGAVAGSHGFVF
jgi:uncharacterized membrane protein